MDFNTIITGICVLCLCFTIFQLGRAYQSVVELREYNEKFNK